MFETEVSERGCFYVAFNNDGKYLACVHSEEYYYPIVVYEVRQYRGYYEQIQRLEEKEKCKKDN